MLSTAINSNYFRITSDRDEDVEGFTALNNKKLEYVPCNLGEKFPNILYLRLDKCDIKKLTKDSFKGLSKLLRLFLHHNRIERIDDDTFETNPAIGEIYLRE